MILRLFIAPILLVYYMLIAILAVAYIGLGWIVSGEAYIKLTWPTIK